ncbi:MAG: putative multidrug-efflux transporter [Deltaproteobacteria bacterium]|jgi:MFS family permease|nr:putative multidrug-efflux transporter [Deltaproteobacteria bacterium]
MSQPEAELVPLSALTESEHLYRLLVLCFGVWLYAADSTLVATVMPVAVEDIGGLPYLSWTYTLYQLGSVVTGAIAGLVVMRTGIVRTEIAAGILYVLGCALSGYAPDMTTMIVGRILQGMGGGALVSLAFIGASTLFPQKMWVRVIAVISGIWGISSLCGPLIGGYFVSGGNWRGAFWAFAVQGLVTVFIAPPLLRRQLHTQTDSIQQAMPFARLGLLSIAVLAICQAGVVTSTQFASGLCAAGIVLLLIFLKQDADSKNRIFPRGILDPRTVSGSGLVMMSALFMATISLTVYGPLLMYIIFGAAPLVAGYVIALESLGWTLTAIFTSGVRERIEPRLIRTGAVFVSVSMLGLIYAMPSGPLWLIALFAVIMGMGFGMSWSFVSKRIIANVPEKERTQASASIPTFMRVAMAMGSALSGIIANYSGFSEASSVTVAQNVAFWSFAAFVPLMLVGLVTAWRVSLE